MATLALVAICCLFMMSMYQITTSINYMEGLIDEQNAKRRKVLFYSLSVAIYVLFVVCVISSLAESGIENVYNFSMQVTLVTFYGLLTIIYLHTLIKLIKAMNRLIASDLKNERRTVIT